MLEGYAAVMLRLAGKAAKVWNPLECPLQYRLMLHTFDASAIVEENRLQNQVSALRRAFGPDHDLIRTVAGRGYQFTGEIRARPGGPAGRSGARETAGDAAQGSGRGSRISLDRQSMGG